MTTLNGHKLSLKLGLVLVAGSACNSVTGLSDFSVSDSPSSVAECTTHQDCVEKATAETKSSEPVPARCLPEGRCATLLSQDCTTVTGDPADENTVLIGSLFATTGATGATNVARQQSAMMAVNEINRVGGVPSSNGPPRKLVMLSCNAAMDVKRAAAHLVDDLKIPAIVGPNTSQDTIDVTNQVSVPGNTVLLSPSAVASSIVGLSDQDLTWLMVPTDVQRAPLMIQGINEIEAQLKAERGVSAVKLGIVFRDDALGAGTRASLDTLKLNGKPIADSSNFGKNVLIDGYKGTATTDQETIVAKYLQFAPDIVVLAGTAESVTLVMKPLEERWSADTTKRPYYVLIDSAKVPDLITLVANNDDLRRRIRGTGVTPAPESVNVFNSFKLSYQTAYPGMMPNASGMGPAYDATYAIAFALAATTGQEVDGPTIAKGLRHLGKGSMIDVSSSTATQAFQKLAQGTDIRAIGTFGPLDWDTDGAVNGGTIEMWCIGGTSTAPAYQSSGQTFAIMTQEIKGEYTQCQ